MLLGATHNHQRIQRLVPFRLDLLPRRAKQFPEILCRDEAKGCRALALAFAVRQLNQLTSL